MLKYIVTLSGALLLSGCVTSKQAQEEERQFRQESIQAVEQSEQNINTQIAALRATIETQNSTIKKLHTNVGRLSYRVDNLAKQNARQLLAKTEEAPKPIIIPSKPIADTQTVLGAIETVEFEQNKISFEARIDTGAETSSLNAKQVQMFERNGKKWVRFDVSNDSSDNAEPVWMEAKFVRYAKVRQSNTDKALRRPVIKLWITVGNIRQDTLFTLADRTHMDHDVLLGREFIKDIALVDVSKTYVQTKPLK
ncbi:ATP-dependent zinc protease family protein [Vibrio gallicus]|uniref:ATP-dependent zinc protease family protein n=1 Tax=Vibrio gallicus TaxID=190897 RepID=UPI0021C43085|nr:ATP-dependent zinc protease [Vibrio gallicus]